ncbi:hypothetical protein [Lactococcus garvieae]|uniref:HNH nuclease domain-containing protein n=1 Tax=Lactococcus garvieae DCC43 TaxID=1231377 RepID=K2PV74_9LACT|nr:hypothetical protein [Lactococcus garvieae]EKF51341.1 hypothetical protein C426_1295 [Lactococcus garvieae DCC43]
MEIRQIPDYPNYGVTRDGRVWSYNINKFMKPYSRPKHGNVIYLWNDGIKFCKYIRRLVFETFTEDIPECVIHKDGNIFNDKLENLKSSSFSEVAITMLKKRKYSNRKICRVNIATKKADIITIRRKDNDYSRINQAVHRRAVTSGGCFYYYIGEKDKLVAEIKARIHSDKLSLESLSMRDKYSPYIRIIKKHIKNHQKYLEILEGIEEYA